MVEEKSASSSEERRTSSRLPVNLRFRYKIINPPDPALGIVHNALTKNLSSNAILFESPTQIPIDTQLEVSLSMPGAQAKTIETTARVARIEKVSASLYDIVIVFENLAVQDQEEIKNRIDRLSIMKILEQINKKEISDLHLTVNSPPMMRDCGVIKPLDNVPLSAEEIQQMVYSILNEEQRQIFDKNKDLDFAFSPFPETRYRVSIYQQRGVTEVVFRNISPVIKSRKELGLPEIIDELCQLRDGIIFISGPTGSGKTTTITTMIDTINRERGGVVLSLEKPIEYIHKNIKALVKQREVGTDVASFAVGLKAALRQDSDVIVVGEVLDSDTIETALQAAETGHLVITSIHATDTLQVFDRIISFFPTQQREFILHRLSHTLRAVINQRLLVHKNGIGRVLATEVCVVTTAVKRVIRNGDFVQLPLIMQTGAQYKMQLLQDCIDHLFGESLISAETYGVYSKKVG